MRSIEDTISTEAARRFYDWLGAGHDRAEFYESRAKRCAINRLDLAPDLPPLRNLPGLLANFRRVLKPGRRMVLVSLTEGVTLPSRALADLWKMAYAISPIAWGGCRPLQLYDLVCEAGFNKIQREVIVQPGVLSEVIAASR